MGELTDWNEPDLSCVIIIRLAVAHTSSNYFRQRALYLNCAPLEVFAFISTEFILRAFQQQAVRAVLSLCQLFRLISALLRRQAVFHQNTKDKLGVPWWPRGLRHQPWRVTSPATHSCMLFPIPLSFVSCLVSIGIKTTQKTHFVVVPLLKEQHDSLKYVGDVNQAQSMHGDTVLRRGLFNKKIHLCGCIMVSKSLNATVRSHTENLYPQFVKGPKQLAPDRLKCSCKREFNDFDWPSNWPSDEQSNISIQSR